MSTSVINRSTFQFLKNLTANNDRDWFNTNKDQYLQSQANVEQFVDQLIAKMNRHDQLETPSGKKCLYRIYNDVRFSKDKTPYNPRFAGYLKRVKPMLRGGYYFWIKPGGSRIACGFGYPNPDDLKRIRQDIDRNYKDWYKLLNLKSINATFGPLQGDQVKTTPKGYPGDHPAIDLLRYKQYWFECSFSDKQVLSGDFLNDVNKSFKIIRPFFNYMSDILTSDLNGESVLD